MLRQCRFFVGGIKMKFIHTADLHLESPFKGLMQLPSAIKKAVENSIYQAMDQLVATAIKLSVDFIIIAGDAFDDATRDLHAQFYLQRKFQELAQHQIAVIMIYGNHDYLTSSQAVVSYPDNVYVFGPEVTTTTLTLADGQKVAFSGFSYNQNHIQTNLAQTYPARLPNVDYQIGILHGELGQKSNYAPFTLETLQSKGYDYWALGHIHQRQILSQNPYVVYPGNLQGRHRNESGDKGYYLVDWDGTTTKLKFISTAAIIWQNVQVSVAQISNLDNLISKIQKAVFNDKNTLVDLTLTDFEQLDHDLQALITSGELLATLQADVPAEHFNYIYHVQPQVKSQTIYQTIDEKYWQSAANQIFTPNNLLKHLGKLQQVPVVRETYQQKDFLSELQQRAVNIISQNKMEE